jgi:HK97 family phage major capsid protein
MSDTKKAKPDWLVRLEEVREKEEDPVVDGLVHIGNHALEANATLDRRIDEADKRTDEINRSVAKSKTELQAQMDAGFGVVSERLDALNKRQTLVAQGKGSSIFECGDRLAAVIPPERKHLIRESEIAIDRASRKGGIGNDDPLVRTVSSLWYYNAIGVQCPRAFGGHTPKMQEDLEKYSTALSEFAGETKAAYAEGATSTGGALVPTIIAAEILRIAKDSSVVVRLGRHIPMTSNQLLIPNEASGVTVGWANEAVQLSQGEGTFGQNILDAKKIYGRAVASIESIQDSIVGLLPYVQMVMAEAIGKELDQEAIEGDGTNFTGLNAETINTVNTTSGDSAAATYRDLVNCVYAADESSVENNAVWIMHRKIFATVVALVDTTGQPIYQPAVAAGVPGTILGYPVYTCSALATNITSGSANTGNMYFGNPQKLIFGDRADLTFDATDTGPGWAKYQVDMRLVGRFGFTVGTPLAWSKLAKCARIADI